MKKLLDSDWLRAVQCKCNTYYKTFNTGENYKVILVGLGTIVLNHPEPIRLE